MSDPFLAAVPCPADLVPRGVRSAIKVAESAGWFWKCNYAIGPGPEFVHSVVFYAHRRSVELQSRHEGPAQDMMGFKSAFKSVHGELPDRLGWRQLMEELGG